MADTTTTPDFWTYLVTNFIADVKQELYPDVVNILNIVEAGGAAALLLPSNFMTVQAFLVKVQADAIKVGDDLSKQIATFLKMWLAAKFAPPAAAKV
jgi:hypothetical protein